ncbi:MAG: arginine--tRNA ligase [Candidatus Buchananbacteria bacterium RBG_13_39_9]|uniref:Arginine--tRNA ligase n=1 Tax=Candidatus Buchananbacteria bacterium RBG_13_39_9 TaxID=1797531 RepID=A0A1G1XUJ2_9BACT|nr:MAG: arginine--tRNA ligase [Candidatus Buchananbacteria bacterium RBG_13_39_9]
MKLLKFMDLNLKIKNEIVKLLAKQKIKIKPEDLEIPPSAEMGDFGLPCFNLAKKLKKSPAEVAKDLASKIKVSGTVVNVKNLGPYLNFVIDSSQIGELAIKEILKQKNKYGKSNIGKGVKVMIEYSQPNTHKEFHIGHLRNVCIGSALINIYKNCGYKVVAANYIGDTGAHVAKTLWYLQNYINETDISADIKERGEFLGRCYTAASHLLETVTKIKSGSPKDMEFMTGKQIINELEERQGQVSEILKKLEDGDKDLLNLWKQTRQWSLDLFTEIYKELNVKFDVFFYESEEEKAGKKMLPKLLKYPFIKKSEGAVIADLQKENLGVLVLVRKDGTALYGIKDIPLAVKKFKKYKIKKSLYIVDSRQAQYLQQIFKILELMDFKKEMIHVPYEFVQLKSGIISSRTGNVVTYEEVKEAALNKVIGETKSRHADWTDDKIKEISQKIVSAALKFGMLKNGNDKVITFDIEESLDTQGFTGPYLQYTLARLNSILSKSEINKSIKIKVDYKNLAANIEKKLIKQLTQYPQAVAEVLKTNDPANLAQYLFNLAQDFNAFYHELPVLKAEPEIKNARLHLISALKQVLENGLELLDLPILQKM